jgi:hypothetical protein
MDGDTRLRSKLWPIRATAAGGINTSIASFALDDSNMMFKMATKSGPNSINRRFHWFNLPVWPRVPTYWDCAERVVRAMRRNLLARRED